MRFLPLIFSGRHNFYPFLALQKLMYKIKYFVCTLYIAKKNHENIFATWTRNDKIKIKDGVQAKMVKELKDLSTYK